MTVSAKYPSGLQPKTIQSAQDITLCVFEMHWYRRATRQPLTWLNQPCSALRDARYPLLDLRRGFAQPTNLEVIVPNSPQGETDPANPSIDDIEWLANALFDLPDTSITNSPDDYALEQPVSWIALPLRGPTRRLVPTGAMFAAEAFSNQHDAMSVTRRYAGQATRAVVRSGALRFGPRLYADPAMVFRDPDVSVIAAAAAGLGTAIDACAITLGPRRYNRKPVVQLMNSDAQTVGFLKVGADEVTSAMVAAEATAVQELQRPLASPLLVPKLLWHSEWDGRSVACFSPVSLDGRALVPADERRLADSAQAIVAAGGGPRHVEFQHCPLVGRLRKTVVGASDANVDRLLNLAVQRFENHTVSIGRWHGDFSPWNMISTAESTALIDWEFSSDDMPIGSDLLHHRIMVATHLDGDSPTRPIHNLRRFGSNVPELHAMGIPTKQHRPHVLLYLLELVRRDLELGLANRPATGFGTPAAEAIEALLAEADR